MYLRRFRVPTKKITIPLLPPNMWPKSASLFKNISCQKLTFKNQTFDPMIDLLEILEFSSFFLTCLHKEKENFELVIFIL